MAAATAQSTVGNNATPNPAIGTVYPTWFGRALIAGPNVLTITRMAISPPLWLCIIAGGWGWALGLYLLGLVTDFMDGTFARTFRSGSPFGRAMDSAADKMLVFAAMAALVSTSYLPMWVLVLFALREFAVFGLRSIDMSAGPRIARIDDRWGRARFIVLHIGVLMMLAYPLPTSTSMLKVGMAVVVVAQLVALVALVYYVKRDWRSILASMNEVPEVVS